MASRSALNLIFNLPICLRKNGPLNLLRLGPEQGTKTSIDAIYGGRRQAYAA